MIPEYLLYKPCDIGHSVQEIRSQKQTMGQIFGSKESTGIEWHLDDNMLGF